MTYLVGYIHMWVTYRDAVVVEIFVGIHRKEPRATARVAPTILDWAARRVYGRGGACPRPGMVALGAAA